MAARFVTYNQIINAFSDIAIAHKQINTFGFGDVWEIATSGNVIYPLKWVVPQDGSLQGKEYVSNFTLIFMDLVHKDEHDEAEVMSDMEQVALDVIAQLLNPEYEFTFKADSINFRRFTERFDDEVTGVAIDIAIRVPFIFDRCAVPSSLVNVSTEPSLSTGFVTILDRNGNFVAFVQSGNTYTIPCGLLGEDLTQLYAG